MRFRSTIILMLAIGLMPEGAMGQVEAGQVDKALLRVVVHSEIDLKELEAADVHVYARLNAADGPVLLIGAGAFQAEALVARALDVKMLDPSMGDKQYYVVYRMPRLSQSNLGAFGRVLYEDETHAILQMPFEDAERLAEAGAELRAVTLDPKPMAVLDETHLAPVLIAPDTFIQEMIAQVDSATVYQYTGDLSGEWPATVGGSPYTIVTRHTYSGDPIQKATQYVGEHLEALGVPVEYHQWGDSTCPNVIGEIPGQGSPDSIVIICAHVDDMPWGPVAPGADDNASGTTAVLVAADIMTQYDWHYTLRFALWTGEEQGLMGSHYYAQRCHDLGEPIVGVLNLDMIAFNSIASSPDIDLHANQSMPETLDLAQLFADAVSAYGLDLICQIVPNGIGASDHASFWDYGYAAILGIEDLGDFSPYYHTTSDQLQYFDMDYYIEFVKASLATSAHMAGVHADDMVLPSITAPSCALLALVLMFVGLRELAGIRSRGRSQMSPH